MPRSRACTQQQHPATPAQTNRIYACGGGATYNLYGVQRSSTAFEVARKRAIARTTRTQLTKPPVSRPTGKRVGELRVKTFLEGFAGGTIVLILIALLFLETGRVDIRADVPPSPWISRFLDIATHASVRRHAPAAQSPLPLNDEQVLIAGGKLYLNDCVGCHGEPGKPSKFGATFYPPVPQLAQTPTRYSEAQIVWIAKHGVRRSGMGAEGASYSDIDYWRLAACIRRLTQLPPRILEAAKAPPASSTSSPHSDEKK
jgi:mono/diheme cytochrome c family protein